MLGDMMGKLQQMKQFMDEAKKRLDNIVETAEAGNGDIKIQITGNREVKDIKISESLLKGDKEELEEMMLVAMNRAIQMAERVNEKEMGDSAKSFLPGFPGI